MFLCAARNPGGIFLWRRAPDLTSDPSQFIGAFVRLTLLGISDVTANPRRILAADLLLCLFPVEESGSPLLKSQFSLIQNILVPLRHFDLAGINRKLCPHGFEKRNLFRERHLSDFALCNHALKLHRRECDGNDVLPNRKESPSLAIISGN